MDTCMVEIPLHTPETCVIDLWLHRDLATQLSLDTLRAVADPAVLFTFCNINGRPVHGLQRSMRRDAAGQNE